MKTEIKLKLKQDINKTDVSEYPNFSSEWENPDPQFLEDQFDELNITKLESTISQVKVYEQDIFFVREMEWTLLFEVNSISDLKEYLSEEFVMTNDQFDTQRFISIFAGNLEEIEVEAEEAEEDELGDVVYLEVNETEISGEIIFT